MARLISILLFNFLLFYGIIGLIRMIRNKDEKDFSPKERNIKCDSEYYWYNKPHYYIMSNGEKINIPDYVSWDDWKNYGKEKRIQICLQIENRILSTRNNDNQQKVEDEEIIKFN